MARIEFGSLREAWRGEAVDFTPLLAQQLDQIGDEIGVDLLGMGQAEVATAGGRSIDIVAQTTDGPEIVVENQYGRADHDHLTRGLAYAVARGARGLVVVAEDHRDEFRAVAQYLNDMAELDTQRGIAVWLVEARAARIAGSPWAPLFTAVVAPNQFTTQVEQARRSEKALTVAEFLALCASPAIREAVQQIVERWQRHGHVLWRYPHMIGLAAKGPGKTGVRGVVTLYPDGSVLIPYGAYAGQNTGIEIAALSGPDFRQHTEAIFGSGGTASSGRTGPGWVEPSTVEPLLEFAQRVARAYATALREHV
ncbi:hypothetical protein [Aeromicrobium sp.]